MKTPMTIDVLLPVLLISSLLNYLRLIHCVFFSFRREDAGYSPLYSGLPSTPSTQSVLSPVSLLLDVKTQAEMQLTTEHHSVEHVVAAI